MICPHRVTILPVEDVTAVSRDEGKMDVEVTGNTAVRRISG
jgi:hypothetical protein